MHISLTLSMYVNMGVYGRALERNVEQTFKCLERLLSMMADSFLRPYVCIYYIYTLSQILMRNKFFVYENTQKLRSYITIYICTCISIVHHIVILINLQLRMNEHISEEELSLLSLLHPLQMPLITRYIIWQTFLNIFFQNTNKVKITVLCA